MFCYSVMSIWLKSTSAHLSSSYSQFCVNIGTGRSILYWKELLQNLVQRRLGMSYRSLKNWWARILVWSLFQINIHQMNYQWIMSSYVSLLTSHTKALLYRTLMNCELSYLSILMSRSILLCPSSSSCLVLYTWSGIFLYSQMKLCISQSDACTNPITKPVIY